MRAHGSSGSKRQPRESETDQVGGDTSQVGRISRSRARRKWRDLGKGAVLAISPEG